MSAHVVPASHINALATWMASTGSTYYWAGRRRPVEGDAHRVAAVLYAENVRSVNSRYRQSDPAHGHLYTCNPQHARLSAVAILAALDCYEYQACECDDWDQSEACAIVHAARRDAIRALPGYESQPWEICDHA